MSQADTYWARRSGSGRFSRRRFVGGAAVAGLGAAGLGLVGCGDDNKGTGAAPAGSPTTAAATPKKGGIQRWDWTNSTFETFDFDRGYSFPVGNLAGLTNLGIVHYKSFEKAELEGAFAEKWEQPDASTLVLKLRPNMPWHDKPPVNGRIARAEDIKFFIDRNKAGRAGGVDDPLFVRKAEFASVDTVTVTDPGTVTVKFSKPNPFFLTTLAGPWAKVQAPEAVAAFEKDYASIRAEHVIGTGAYVLTELKTAGSFKLRRFDRFAMGDPLLDGHDFFEQFPDYPALQTAFERKQIDIFFPNVEIMNDLLKRLGKQIYKFSNFAFNPLAGTYYGGAAPWNNRNLIGAIFRSIDRRALIQQLYQGNAALSGNIPPPQSAFGLSDKELITFPGYLEDHTKDLAEAKKMWEAGAGQALGDVVIDLPDAFVGSYPGVGPSIAKMLRDNLGNAFNVKVEPYSTIVDKLVKQKYGNGSNNIWYGWIANIAKLEPTLDLWRQYNSTAPQFSQTGVKIDKVDELTGKAILELDAGKRKQYDIEINKELLNAYGAGVPYISLEVSDRLAWNYYKVGEIAAFTNTHTFWNTRWIDQTDPTWQGRPA